MYTLKSFCTRTSLSYMSTNPTSTQRRTGPVSFRWAAVARIFSPLLARKSIGFALILHAFLPENGYLNNFRGLQPPPPPPPRLVRLCFYMYLMADLQNNTQWINLSKLWNYSTFAYVPKHEQHSPMNFGVCRYVRMVSACLFCELNPSYQGYFSFSKQTYVVNLKFLIKA